MSRVKVQAVQHALQLTGALAQACAAAGVTDPAELPALIAFARAAEAFDRALGEHAVEKAAWDRFLARHGADDPANEYHALRVHNAAAVLHQARQQQALALHAWHEARGLVSTALAA